MPINDPFAPGRQKLHQPILPLVRLAQLLYLTGPFATMNDLLAELPAPLETDTAVYDQPAALLAPYLPILEACNPKESAGPAAAIYDAAGEPLSGFEAAELWVGQEVLVRELEEINSLLCGPCGCTLCCTGPDQTMTQEFFEIPLAEAERGLFAVPETDSAASRWCTALSEPPLIVGGMPFYRNFPGLYHWRTGWSLILPRGSACPLLATSSSRCRIYSERPTVCRRPQIFPYLLERLADPGHGAPTYVARHKLLAVWDCPYVREFKEEIAAYAGACGLEPVFKENKA